MSVPICDALTHTSPQIDQDGVSGHSRRRFVHELFEEQTRRVPDWIAVVSTEGRWTYRDLNRRANRIARELISLGVGPDDRVAICVQRSMEMIAGLLAILKSGAGYVPLDPTYPAERRAFMLKDSGPAAIVSQACLDCVIREGTTSGVPVVLVDGGGDDSDAVLGAEFDENPVLVKRAEQGRSLAYVIYTSGSTGTPKGVQIERDSLQNLLNWYGRLVELAPGSAVLIVTSYSFDMTQKNLLGPLQAGGRVVLADEPFNCCEILRQMEREQITHLNLTPSAFYALAEADDTAALRCLRFLMLGGEPIQPALLAKLPEPRPAIFNFYGPTECTIFCAYHRLAEDLGDYAGRRVPIGKAIPNMALYILDARGEPVGPGEVGEIYIAGKGVARGYLGRPDLTAERFIPGVYGTEFSRMYRTGDLGRYSSADGVIEFLGREDDQVKVRGFRIELGEIEARLRSHSRVSQAVVIAREDLPGGPALVAYVTLTQSGRTAGENWSWTLRSFVEAALPEYMVPAAFVVLDVMPLTPTGKLDRRALPPPDTVHYAKGHFVPPEGEFERELAGIWADLLRVPAVSRFDRFFNLGGHSLLLMQLNERLRRIGLAVEIRDVFSNPTLAEMARSLKRKGLEVESHRSPKIPAGCQAIAPEMLPLVSLLPHQVQYIVEGTPGGAGNVQDIYPLAPLQEGILFHHLLATKEEGDKYVLPRLFECRSPGSARALIAALQFVVDRHDILRSAFVWEGVPRPVQVVHRRAPLPVEEGELDLSRSPLEQMMERLDLKRQYLDLRKAPTMRIYIGACKQSSRRYVLVQMHHIATDHVTAELLLSEVYAHLLGQAGELPEPAPYRDHIATVLERERADAAREFFHKKLGDVGEPTAPFGLLDVRDGGSRAAVASQSLGEELVQRIQRLKASRGISPATLFHAAWALVVSRTSGRDDIVFGTVLSGRLRESNSRSAFGMFINTLPLRLKLGSRTVEALVEQVRCELGDLLEHEQTLLAEAQKCSGVSGTAPVFSATINYVHGTWKGCLDGAETAGVRLLTSREWTNYPIMLSVEEWADSFVLIAQTDESVDPNRLIAYVVTTLESFVGALETAQNRALHSVSIIPSSEKHRLLVEFNATQAAVSQGCVHELFEAQVARDAAATALVFEGETLSYGELNGRANRLAHHLRALGVGPDVLVGICMERSLEMVVGLLAILKAGGAYVPLDPAYPRERLGFMLGDCAPAVVLTYGSAGREALRAALADAAAAPRQIDLGADQGQWAGQPASNPDSKAIGLTGHNLAYVIYTSGSTGRPKGVMIEHRNTVNLLQWARTSYGREVFQRTLFSTSINFDLAVYECFVPLTLGTQVHVVQNVLRLSPSCEATLINTVPSAIGSLLEAGGISPATRAINLAGEALGKALVDRVFAGSNVESISNLYGPSETTTYSTWIRMGRETGFAASIGRPIANTRIYILDGHLQPAPLRVTGEIYIGGAGVARGYLNRAQLTSERFIASPFVEGDRLYRTGDLGRWLEDGTIEFLGRNDHQVKVRGFRIELGEIEARIGKFPGVSGAVVLAREDAPGDKRLVAYVTMAGGALDAKALKEHLAEALPEYMVPSAYVALAALPLTPNGKLDRNALPPPGEEAYRRGVYEAPIGKMEILLAGIWARVLRLERVGRRDNFFSLGGDSILTIQVVAQAKRHGLRVTTRQVFDRQTIAELAPQVVPLTGSAPQENSIGEMALLPIHRQFFLQGTTDVHHYQQARIFKPPRGFTLSFLTSAVHALYRRHDALRLRYRRQDGTWRAAFTDFTDSMVAESVGHELLKDSDPTGEIQQKALSIRSQIDIGRGPLLRAVLFEGAAPSDARLLLVFHHLIIDGVSWRILLEDLSLAFTQWTSGQAIQLPQKTTSYQAWGAALLRYSTESSLPGRRDYWLEVLKSLKQIPVDRAVTGDIPHSSRATETVQWTPGETQELLGPCNTAYSTRVNELLLAGLMIAIQRWRGCRRAVIATEGHGREERAIANAGQDLDLSHTIGWFTSYYPMRLELPEGWNGGSGNPDRLTDVIKAIKEQCRSVPRQGLDYGVLRYLLQDQALTAQCPQGPRELVFNYLGQFDSHTGSDAPFREESLDIGPDVSPNRMREHRLEINGAVHAGRLFFVVDFSPLEFLAESIRDFVQCYERSLREVIEHCCARRNVAFTPADFPLAALSQDSIDRWHVLYPQLKDIYPATGLQLGLIFHSQVTGSESVYSNQIHLDIAGVFEPQAFKAAWQAVFDRHDVFRTAFVGMDLEVPLQLVVSGGELPWKDIDHRSLSPAEACEAFEALRREQRARPFAFNHPSLMRFVLVRENETRYRFIWTFHHAVLDGWSVSLIWRELLALYAARVSGVDAVLPAPRPFSRYIRWLKAQDPSAGTTYWQRYLAGFRAPTRIGIDRPGVGTEAGLIRLNLTLSEAQSRRLLQAARLQRISLASIFQGAWASLLQLYSGEDDVVFGVTASGRAIDVDGAEEIIGLLINTLPLRVRTSPGARGRGNWLRSIHADQVDRELYGHVPLGEIQRCSEVPPGAPLFDTVVILENYPSSADESGLAPGLCRYKYEEQTHYGVALLVVPGEKIQLGFEFDAARFQKDDAKTMTTQLQGILEGLSKVDIDGGVSIESPEPVAAKALSKASRQGELRLGRYLVHQLFENHAASNPEAIAIRCGKRRYTYGEANRIANRMANHILAKHPDITADCLVGVMAPRTEGLLLTILAIWKAGAAYIPIDPRLPSGRVRMMLRNSGARLLIADSESSKSHSVATWEVPSLTLEDIVSDLSQAEVDLDINVSGHDLAYVIYTSGSTGTPKGVMVEHIGVLNNIANKVRDFEVTERSRVAQVASTGFDISVWQMFIALTQGGSTVIYEDEIVTNVGLFVRLLKEDEISILEVVPSYLVLLIERLQEGTGDETLPSMEYLVLTGEAADATFIRRWFELFPQTRVVNAYGPTEASDDVTHYVITSGQQVSNPVPIGSVLGNFDLYIVDDDLNPVPLGEKGEIVVSGIGVGRGYVNLLGATQAAFVDSPFPDRYKGRLYRTGDIGQMREDGVVLFFGRKDQQVKIHGFRIELEEIEATLKESPAVRQCAVLAVTSAGEDAHLCGFLVPYGELDKESVVEYLKQSLPSYMIPTEFRFLKELPLLPNGKVDRASLRNLAQEQKAVRSYRAPASRLEGQLVQIWSEVMHMEQVSTDDDFFDLGGDSFKAIRIAAKYGPGLEVSDIYDGRTIEVIAKVVGQRSSQETCLSALVPRSTESRLVVVAIANSGGGPVSFFELAKAVAAVRSDVAFYAVKLPRRSAETAKALVAEVDRLAEEICEELDELKLPVVVLAQCNGSALGIRLAQRLEARSAAAKALIVGGALLRMTETAPDCRNDREIMGFLESIGSTLPVEPDDRAFFVSDFRYDCALANAFYNSLLAPAGGIQRISAALYCVVGTEDPLVRGYKTAVEDWRHLADKVTLREYPGYGHYLLRDCPERLARTICEIVEELNLAPVQPSAGAQPRRH